MKYTPEILERLHAELLDILSEIIRVCDVCGIDYFIQGGTAIGAFFYEDIIPWDDDIDLGMTRPNYLKFLKAAPAALRPEYALQEFTAEPSTPFYFAKVRKRGTLFIEHPYEQLPIEQGIYVDVFPFDRIPDNSILERLQRFEVKFWVNCFEGKTQWLWQWFAPSPVADPLPKSRLSCAAIRAVTALRTKEQIYRRMNRALGRYNKCNTLRVNIVRMPLDQIARKNIEHLVEMTLGGVRVKAPADVESYLRHHYVGLTKEVPPEKQVNHAPVVLSFDTKGGEIYGE